MAEFDPFKLETSSIKRRKTSTNWLPIALGVVGLAFVVFMVFLLKGGPGGSAPSAGSSARPASAVDETGQADRKLMAFVQEFLLYYYNYTYNLYPKAIQKAEGMMTQDMLKAYSTTARNRDFYNNLVAKRVSTSAVRIVPGSVSIGEQDGALIVSLGIVMTYTTGINGATAEFPSSVALEIIKTDQGFKVNNVEKFK